MQLDCLGREGYFAYLQKMGFTGTEEEWLAELLRHSDATAVRLFRDSRLCNQYARYPGLKEFVHSFLERASPRFDSVRVDAGYHDPYISFNVESARREEVCPRPLRLDGIAMDIEERDQEDYCLVRVRTYVNCEFRRDKYFRFEAKKSKKGGRV